MEYARGVQHPQHSAAAATQLVIALDHIALNIDTAYDWPRSISQRVDQPNAAVHTITTQCRLALAFERHAHLDYTAIVEAEAFTFRQEMPRKHYSASLPP